MSSAERLQRCRCATTPRQACRLVYNAGVDVRGRKKKTRVIGRLNAAVRQAVTDESVRRRFTEVDIEAVQSNPEDAATYIANMMAVQDRLRLAVFGTAR